LSLGERPEEDLAAWREAGADRYLLRFETSDRALFDAIHPPLGNRRATASPFCGSCGKLGYEVGSGIMVGHSRPDLCQRGGRHRAVSANWIWT
jgi:biotin synthase